MPTMEQQRAERLRILCEWGERHNTLSLDNPLKVFQERAGELWPFFSRRTHRSYAVSAVLILERTAAKVAARDQAS